MTFELKPRCQYSPLRRALLQALYFSLLYISTSTAGRCEAVTESPLVAISVEARFIDVFEALRSAIVGRSLSIAHTIKADEVLATSQADYGAAEAVYRHARTIEFCSSKLSHQLVLENPKYLALCPFALSLYELRTKPGTVVIVYRDPLLMSGRGRQDKGEKGGVLTAVDQLYQQLIKDATLWFPRSED